MGIKLVLADDAPFIRDVLRNILESHAEIVVVGEAANGEEAVELAKSLQPDVILMDIVMPKKSGIEATQEILKFLPRCRVVACSTVDQENMVLRAIEAGCCSYVVKPFKRDDVIKAIGSAAQIHTSNKEI